MKTNLLHRIIPIFITEKACPFRCVYCNQYSITSHAKPTDPADVSAIIDHHLSTIPDGAEIKVGFFGGSFTGLSIREQNHYLDAVQPNIESGKIAGIQLSTRPDYINEQILDNLKKKHVLTIELGAQSLDETVLEASGRGHTVDDVVKASLLVKQYHFELGLQMMVGLPYDTPTASMKTAEMIVALHADNTRIYPALVIKDTLLAEQYLKGLYRPLSLQEAVDRCLPLFRYFNEHHVTILRIGLHPSEELINKTGLLAGPFHVSFKELVLTAHYQQLVMNNTSLAENCAVSLTVHPKMLNALIGYHGSNKKLFYEKFGIAHFYTNEKVKMYECDIEQFVE